MKGLCFGLQAEQTLWDAMQSHSDECRSSGKTAFLFVDLTAKECLPMWLTPDQIGGKFCVREDKEWAHSNYFSVPTSTPQPQPPPPLLLAASRAAAMTTATQTTRTTKTNKDADTETNTNTLTSGGGGVSLDASRRLAARKDFCLSKGCYPS